MTMYDQGREDSLAGVRPMLANADYMMGYNESQEDAGLPRLQPPSDGGGQKLNPDLLKGALPGKRWGQKVIMCTDCRGNLTDEDCEMFCERI